MLKGVENTFAYIGHDDAVLQQVIVCYLIFSGKRVCVSHDGANTEWDAGLALDTLVGIGFVHRKSEIQHVVSQQAVQTRCLGKFGIHSYVRVSLHEYKCSHTDIGGDKGTDTDAQFSGHAVVECIDMLLAVFRQLQYFLGTWQKCLSVLGEHDAVRCAYQQLAAQFVLQSLDVLTDG